VTTRNELDGLEVKTGGALDRCSVSQLRNLLRLGVEPSGSSSSLPAEAGSTEELARLLTEFLPEEAQSGQVLLDTVCTPDAPLPVLGQVKDLAKRLVEQAPSERHRNAGRVLYHAAIAAAYARHGENISTLPVRPRLPLYEDLATVLGGEPLGGVFLRAAERASEDG
jgi:hypothetical protein